MFTAILLICIQNTSICLDAYDTRGPYETLKECEERVVEMAKTITAIQNDYIPKAFKCLQNGEQT
jgi:hypothetical protein